VQLNRELQFLKPLLRIGEPVGWATAGDDDYVAKSLLCGDQTIMVMVFDRRYFSRERNGKFYTPPFGMGLVPVKVNVRIPREISVKEVRSLSSSLRRDSWNCREGNLDFAVDMIDSVQVYLIDLQSTERSS